MPYKARFALALCISSGLTRFANPDEIAYAMSNGLVGGLGCYPNQRFIHIDVRERPAGYTRPVTFSGC